MPRIPIHPGEHLAEELREIGITAAELSRQIDVPVNRITGIIHGQRGITADTALRLGHWFGTSPQFWMNLQQLYRAVRASGRLRDKFGARVIMSRRVKRPLAKSRASGDRPKGARPFRGSHAERPQAHRPGGKPLRFSAQRAEKPAPFIAEPAKA